MTFTTTATSSILTDVTQSLPQEPLTLDYWLFYADRFIDTFDWFFGILFITVLVWLAVALCALVGKCRRCCGRWRWNRRDRHSTYADGLLSVAKQAEATVRASHGQVVEFIEGAFDVELKEHAIVDKKTDAVFVGGSTTTSRLFLQADTIDVESSSVAHKKLRGTRRQSSGFFVIEQGLVAPTGHAYWVEHGRGLRVLTVGEFIGDGFHGEWLDSLGRRGRYAQFERVSADEPIVAVGVPLGQE